MPAALYLCLHLRDFAAQAMACAHPELQRRPLAILSGTPPLEYVFAVNRRARVLGLERGMGRMQAESFVPQHANSRRAGDPGAEVAIRPRERSQEERAFATLVECAGRFSPRIEVISAPEEHSFIPAHQQQARWEPCSEATLVLDIANSSRLLGTPEQIAKAIEREVGDAGFEASIAVSQNAYAAVLAARGMNGAPNLPAIGGLGMNTGITIISPGREAYWLAPLPLSVLRQDEQRGPERTRGPQRACCWRAGVGAGSWLAGDEEQTLAAWGIRTLGQLAALPSRSLAARLGQSGLRLQQQARGEYDHLLLPTEEPVDAPLSAGIELEHPVELLQPLLFLMNQLLQQVLEAAQQRALAIASLELTLIFESGTDGGANLPSFGKCEEREKHDLRTVRPALPERDPAVLLKLIQLELELRPPAAGVIALRVVAHPARPKIAQQGLFAAQAPEPGRMAVLLACLRKLVGEGRSGSPELLDSRAPEAFRMTSFALVAAEDQKDHSAEQNHPPALRMLRPPREVAVELCRGAPMAIRCDGQRRTVQASSGPWRTSGEWWTHPGFHPSEPNTGSLGTPGWCREEWEVALQLPHPSPKAGERVGQPPVVANEESHDGNETVRLAHDPANGVWYVIGIYD